MQSVGLSWEQVREFIVELRRIDAADWPGIRVEEPLGRGVGDRTRYAPGDVPAGWSRFVLDAAPVGACDVDTFLFMSLVIPGTHSQPGTLVTFVSSPASGGSLAEGVPVDINGVVGQLRQSSQPDGTPATSITMHFGDVFIDAHGNADRDTLVELMTLVRVLDENEWSQLVAEIDAGWRTRPGKAAPPTDSFSTRHHLRWPTRQSRIARRAGSVRVTPFLGAVNMRVVVLSVTLLTIAGGASRDVSSNATASSIIALIVLIGLSAAAGRWVAQRRSTTRGSIAWFAAFASIAGILALTLARHGAPQAFRPGDTFAWIGSGWDRLSSGNLIGSSQFVLNTALFIPAGAAWTWVTGYALRSLAALVALAMVIESMQGIAGLGAPDITDVAANSIGAAIGVAATALLVAGLRRARVATTRDRPDSQREAIVVMALVLAVITSLTVVLVGADRHQARIRDELEQALGDTTYDDIDAVLRGDPEQLEPDARFSDSEQIFSAASVRADGFNYAEDRIELRWPASYFGFRRCVYVVWQPGSVEFRNVSGSACTDFIG